MFEKFWQENLKEIQENKIRFAAICICFAVAAVLFLSEDSGGEEIILADNPAPVENIDTPKKPDANTKIVPVKNSSVLNENVKILIGANSADLIVGDPFKIPPKEKVIPPPELPPVIIQPVAQVPTLTEEFVLRGTVIIGDNKTALIQKISDGKKSKDGQLILRIGDNLNGKRIVDIGTDSVIFEDGENLYINIQTP